MNMIMIFMTTITDMEMIKTMAIIICAPSIYPNPSPFIGSTNISSSAGKDWFNNPDPDPLLVEKLTMRECQYFTKTQEVLENPSPLPSRFPSTHKIALGNTSLVVVYGYNPRVSRTLLIFDRPLQN